SLYCFSFYIFVCSCFVCASCLFWTLSVLGISGRFQFSGANVFIGHTCFSGHYRFLGFLDIFNYWALLNFLGILAFLDTFGSWDFWTFSIIGLYWISWAYLLFWTHF